MQVKLSSILASILLAQSWCRASLRSDKLSVSLFYFDWGKNVMYVSITRIVIEPLSCQIYVYCVILWDFVICGRYCYLCVYVYL